jgi:tripartite-type tricarboxylate transporter receptor subunit TctC
MFETTMPRTAGLEVDVVGAGRGDRDHLQGGQRGDQFGVDLQFVDDGYRRSGEPLLDLACRVFACSAQWCGKSGRRTSAMIESRSR